MKYIFHELTASLEILWAAILLSETYLQNSPEFRSIIFTKSLQEDLGNIWFYEYL